MLQACMLQVFNDKAVTKEMSRMDVCCCFEACDWSGIFQNLDVSSRDFVHARN